MPATGATVELLLGTTWTDITPDVYLRDRIKITRGRADQGSRVDPGSCTLTLNNKSGRYSPRNPLSPLYGQIGRNTPVRVSVHAGTPYLDHPASGTDRRVSTPTTAALQITGDLDVRWDVEPSDWDSGDTLELGGKWGAAGQRAWHAYLFAGTIRLGWTTDGTTEITAAAPLQSVAHTKRLCLRATIDVNNGSGGRDVAFYTGPSLSGPWAQIGTTQTTAGTSNTASSTAVVEIGDVTTTAYSHVQGRIYAAQIRSGIGGTLVASPDFTAQAVGALTFTDGAGVPWTANGASALTNRRTRFVGEISAWPSRWDVSGGDVYVPVQAAGIMRRLGQGATPLDSTMRRSVAAAGPLAYWPLEDGSASTQAASGLVGGQAMPVVAGAPSWAATDGPPGSLSLPDFSNGGTLVAQVPNSSATSWSIDALLHFTGVLPTGGLSIVAQWNVGGLRAQIWELDAASAADGGLSIQWANNAFSDLGGPYYSNVSIFDGKWHHVRISVAQVGSAITVQLFLDGVRIISASEPAVTLGAVHAITVNPIGGLADDATPSLGHLAVWAPATTTPTYLAMGGYDGETTDARAMRLAAEEGVPVRRPYGPAGDAALGPQQPATLLDLLEEGADAEFGILGEARGSIALSGRPRASLYNQKPALVLNYAARGEVAPPLEPNEDDTASRNDITIGRPNGSSAQATLDAGPLSTVAPPSGIGRYTDSRTLNVHSDVQLANLAWWALHLGTWDEARYPSVTVNLAAGPWLAEAACEVDTGDVITIANPPAWLPPDLITLMAQGYGETIGVYDWDITYNCTPGGPWTVGVWDDPVLGRADTDGSQLAAGTTATATTLSVAVTAGPLWVTTAANAAEFPFDIRVGGEVMTVTAITGTSSPQSFTVTRAVNGVRKAQSAAADVRLAHPMILAL